MTQHLRWGGFYFDWEDEDVHGAILPAGWVVRTWTDAYLFKGYGTLQETKAELIKRLQKDLKAQEKTLGELQDLFAKEGA